MTGAEIPNGTPILLCGVILQLVLIVVSAAICYPFFRMPDKQALEEEAAAVAE